MFDCDVYIEENRQQEEQCVDERELKSLGALKQFYDDFYAVAQENNAPTSSQFQTHQQEFALVLYSRSSCPYCCKVLKYMKKEKINIPVIDLNTNPAARSELVQIGGKGQVPCLVINGHALYESSDIINWLKVNRDRL